MCVHDFSTRFVCLFVTKSMQRLNGKGIALRQADRQIDVFKTRLFLTARGLKGASSICQPESIEFLPTFQNNIVGVEGNESD